MADSVTLDQDSEFRKYEKWPPLKLKRAKDCG